MRLFFQSAAGAFIGKLLAALLIAVCVALGVGPEEWAAFVLGDLSYFRQILARIGFVSLAAVVFGSLIWPKLRSSLKGIKFRLPISRNAGHLSDQEISRRIFHFRSDVRFDRLEEYMVRLELAFFNCSDHGVVVERVTGLIICDPPFDAFPLETPHLDMGQTATEGRPVDHFVVMIEQRVPRELVPLITQKLAASMPFSFTLTGLTLWLRRLSGDNSFAVDLWHGISCEKKRDHIVCAEVKPAAGRTIV